MLLIRMGDSYRIEGNLEKAKTYYEEVISFDPKNKYANHGLHRLKAMSKKK